MLSLIFMNMIGFILCIMKSKVFGWYNSLFIFIFMTVMSCFLIYSPLTSFCFYSDFICLDSMSIALIALTCWISAMMMLGSFGIKLNSNSFISFSFVVLLLNFSLLLAFSASNVVWFYIFFELSLLPTLFLILGWGYQPERLQAGMYMMMYTIIASLPLLMLLLLSSSMTGNLSLFLEKICMVKDYSWLYHVQWLFLFLAFLIKTPVFSAHLWLPKAHVEAPMAGSMVLAGVLLKLGGYGMLRMMQLFCYGLSSFMMFILIFSLCGGVMTSLTCLRQTDVKSLVAYSSIGHMSLVVGGSLSNTVWGWQGSLSMMIAHGLCSSSLFALAGFNYEKVSSRSLYLSKGMLMILPSMSLWWFLSCVGNMAAPPTINLLSEIMLFMSSFFVSSWLVIPLGMMTFLAAAYSLYLYSVTQHGGVPKFLSSFIPMKSQVYLLLFLHVLPMNLLILKSDVISFWVF